MRRFFLQNRRSYLKKALKSRINKKGGPERARPFAYPGVETEQELENSPLEQKIARAITPTAAGMGFDIVRVLMVGAGKPTLQVMAEKPDGSMPADDCGKLSHAIGAVLDVENIIPGAYYLEVSSPGIDRPLTRLKDFEKHVGFDAKVEIEPGVNGQKKFKGRITAVNGATVSLHTEEGQDFDLPFAHIRRAKLTLTDDLLKSAQLKKANEKQG